MDEELFSRRIAEAHAHVRLLQRQAEHQASGSDVLADAFQELETALEELRVADEQLRVQTQELVVTRDQVEAEHRRYKLLFEAAPDAYFVTDLHGSIREANRAARRLLGIPEAFLIGKPFGTYVAADAREGFRQTLRRLRDERSVDGWEFTLTPREGEPVEIMVTAALVDDPADRTSRIYWLVRDVTRQRRSEEEVRRLNRELERRVAERTEELVARTERERAARMFAEEAEARLAFLSEASRIFSSSLDVDATLFTVPRIAVPRLADWCGVFLRAPELPAEPASPLDLVTTSGGEPATDPLAGEMARHLRPAVASVYASGQPMTSGPADGPAPLVRGSIPDEPVRDAEGPLAMVCPLIARGRTIGVIAYVASAERHFSRADLRLAEELTNRAALAIENARLYREAREAVQLRDHFLSIIAHDLKGPVATIKGYAQLARRLVTRAQVAEAERLQQAFGAIDATANRLATQIDELLDLSRLQLGRSLGLERRPVDLAELARAVIANYQETSPSHRFRVASDPTSVVGAWDARRLERVLGNLLSNAVKFSPSGGEIAVRIGTESGASGDWAILTVTDNGIGIPAQDLPRIFEPFERAANASDRTGSGIGLASAKQIVEEHGGTIAVESAEGKGTTFIVRLPLGSSERP